MSGSVTYTNNNINSGTQNFNNEDQRNRGSRCNFPLLRASLKPALPTPFPAAKPYNPLPDRFLDIFQIGGYQVLDKWLKDRKKAKRTLSFDEVLHYQKVVVALKETMQIMLDIDQQIPAFPLE